MKQIGGMRFQAFQGVEVVVDEEQDISFFLYPYVDNDDPDDEDNALSTIDDGYFIPIKSARWLGSDIPYVTPAWKENQGFAITQKKLSLKHLNNVDLVLTSDKSKWSKCIVVETAVPDYQNFGIATQDSRTQFELRSGLSLDESGNTISEDDTGMSYFPGYAIDVETGERLNVFFGENSAYNAENDSLFSQITGEIINTGGIGSDMLWNPNSELFAWSDLTSVVNAQLGIYNAFLSGQHFIYVTRQEYDECAALRDQLGSGGLLNKIDGVSFITWTGIPTPMEPLLSVEEGIIPNDLTVKLRVNKSIQ